MKEHGLIKIAGLYVKLNSLTSDRGKKKEKELKRTHTYPTSNQSLDFAMSRSETFQSANLTVI